MFRVSGVFERLADFRRSVTKKGTTVDTMLPDQVGYTLLGAVAVDPDGGYWLRPDYPIAKRSSGPLAGHIEIRVERRWDGYRAYLTSSQQDNVNVARRNELSIPTRLLHR